MRELQPLVRWVQARGGGVPGEMTLLEAEGVLHSSGECTVLKGEGRRVTIAVDRAEGFCPACPEYPLEEAALILAAAEECWRVERECDSVAEVLARFPYALKSFSEVLSHLVEREEARGLVALVEGLAGAEVVAPTLERARRERSRMLSFLRGAEARERLEDVARTLLGLDSGPYQAYPSPRVTLAVLRAPEGEMENVFLRAWQLAEVRGRVLCTVPASVAAWVERASSGRVYTAGAEEDPGVAETALSLWDPYVQEMEEDLSAALEMARLVHSLPERGSVAGKGRGVTVEGEGGE